MPKIKITRLPKAVGGGAYGAQTPPVDNMSNPYTGSYRGGNTPEIKVNETLQPTSKENATLEAELGETVVTNLQGEGLPEFYKIAGKPHSRGGTPLNLPSNSFIFSQNNKLKIKDSDTLKMFGKTAKGAGYTPAEISKSYNLNKYREVLANPYNDKIQRETAEKMIQNYNLKLGALALVQESMKGFETGIPALAMGYMEHAGISPEELLGQAPQPTAPPQMKMGGESRRMEGGGANDFMEVTMKERPDWMNAVKKTKGAFMDKIAGIGRALTGVDEEEEMLARTGSDYMFDSNSGVDLGQNTFLPSGTPDPYNSKMGAQFQGLAKYGAEVSNKNKYIKKADGTIEIRTQGGEFIGVVKPGQKEKFDGGGATGALPRLPGGMKYYTMPDGSIEMRNRKGYVVQVIRPAGSNQIPETASRSKKVQDMKRDAIKWDPKAEGYDRTKVRKNHYIMGDDGKYRKVTGHSKAKADAKYFDDDERLGKYADDYALLKQTFEEDPELKKAFIDNYRSTVKKVKVGKLTQAQINSMRGLTDKQIMDIFYLKQKQNLAVQNKMGNIDDPKDAMDHDRSLAKKILNDLDFEQLPIDQIGAFQAAYTGLYTLSQDDKYKGKLKNFKIADVGVDDESGALTGGRGTISDIDGYEGNTTIGQAALAMDSELATEDVPEIDGPADVKHMKVPPTYQGAKPWTQDLVNLGFAGSRYFDIEKAKPFEAPLATRYADPNTLDFRGGAARIGSQVAAGAQQAGTLMGPQAFAATFANMQKGAADSTMKLQEQEYQGNQNILNKFEMFNTGVHNKAAQVKQGLATKLYDKHQIVNQQFKNAKWKAANEIRNATNQLITNRGQTQSLNAMHDDFAVDPTTGFTYKKDTYGRIDPKSPSTAMSNSARKIMRENPGMEAGDALKWAKADAGISDPEYPAGVNPAAYSYPGVGQRRT